MEKQYWDWAFLDFIKDEPAYLERVDNYELQRLGSMITRNRKKILKDVDGLKFLNPDREDSISCANFPEWAKLDLWEQRLNAELDRRAGRDAKSKPGRKAKQPRTFESCFKDGGLEKLLTAAASTGIIAKDDEGYIWPDETLKTHRVCALWSAAVDAGLTRDNLQNNETITKAVQTFFRMPSLSKDTIDKSNPHNKEFKRVKSLIINNLKHG